jgi:hypothetical protein
MLLTAVNQTVRAQSLNNSAGLEKEESVSC